MWQGEEKDIGPFCQGLWRQGFKAQGDYVLQMGIDG
jgi:hypothetical protein